MNIFKKIIKFFKKIVTSEEVEDVADMAIQFGADALVALLKNKFGPGVAKLIDDLWPSEIEGIVKKQQVVELIKGQVLDFLIQEGVPAGVKAAKDLADSLVQSVYNDNPKTEVAKAVQFFVAKQPL